MSIKIIGVNNEKRLSSVKLGSEYQVGWKNEYGTSDLIPSTGNSWKDYWKAYTGGYWPKKCSVFCCDEEAEVGAHVINPAVSRRDFIVPMCRGCNAKYDEYDPESMILEDGTILVDANL